MEEYINYVKTLLVHGYTPDQIRALLAETGVDKSTLHALDDYMKSTALQNPQHRKLAAEKKPTASLPQDYMHTDYVKKNFEFVVQQFKTGKTNQEISDELSQQGVDDTTKAILLELANRNVNRQTQTASPPNQIPDKRALQRKTLNRLVVIVAVIQPLGVLPQVFAVYGHHNASGVAVSTWIFFVLFDAVWAWYGYVEKQKAVFISGILFMSLELMVVIGALLYGGNS